MTHGLASMLKQRVFGLCLGYEDLNDQAELRCDVLLKTAAERDAPLAPPRPCVGWRTRAPISSITARSGQ
jgi:hypothetical protein